MIKNFGKHLRKTYATLLFVAIGFLMFDGVLHAQTFYGSVVGTVTDKSGAVVAGATVTITDLGTNEKRTENTNGAGEFSFVNLVPANYKLEAAAAGFKSFVRNPVTVAVDTTTRINASMQVGASSETVEVTTATPLLQTESGTLGDTIDSKQLDSLSLNGRNAMNLLELIPGIVPQGNTLGSAAMNGSAGSASQSGGTTSVGWGNYQIGGGMPSQSAIFIDGAPTMIMQKDTAALVPTQDAVQEFKVESGGVSSEWGRFGGGVISITTKSGTNKFHGGIYEYIRNRIVNADDFFDKRNGLPTPEWTQNQYGGTVGGPILKNRAFFFAGFEQQHIRKAIPYSTNVPTAGMFNGVIPEVYSASGVLQNSSVTDPRGLCNIQHNAGTAASPGNWTILNLATCEDPSAKIFAQFYNTAPKNPGNGYNYNTQYSAGDDNYQINGRVDFDITSKNRFFSRFTLWPTADEAPNVIGVANGYPTIGDATHNHTNQIVAGDTHIINPTTILDVRVDYLRQYGDSVPPTTSGITESSFGAPFGAVAPYENYHVLPAFSFGGKAQLHNLFNFSYSGISRMYYNNYHLSASITKNWGKHNVKLGFEQRLIQRDDVGNTNAPSGSFTFGADLAGDEVAQFLEGVFDSDSLNTAKGTTTYSWYTGAYVADTWQASHKLTISAGLRFDVPGSIAEANNNLYVLLPNAVDPITTIKGTLALVNTSLWPDRHDLNVPGVKFDPRLGFAYRLTDNTVIRGAYSLSYLTYDEQPGAFANGQSINSAVTSYSNSSTPSAANSFGPGGAAYPTCLTGVAGNQPNCFQMGINPFPITTSLPTGVNPSLGKAYTNFMVPNIGGAISGPVPQEPYPTSEAMNLSGGHQFKGDVLLDIGVVHTLGYHLPSLTAGINQLPDQYDACGLTSAVGLPTQCATYLSNAIPGGPLVNPYTHQNMGSNLQNYGQSLRPFPYYSNVSNATSYHGTTSYNALDVSFKKRFHTLGQIGAAYTWMKMIGDTDTLLGGSQEVKASTAGGGGEGVYQDYNHPKAERAIYSYDVPHRLVVSYVINLPFGHGQKFASNANGFANALISGWALNGISSFQTGYPMYLITSGNKLSSQYGAGVIRPNYTPGCTKTLGGSAFSRTLPGATWFNTSCFSLPNTPGLSGAGSSASYGFGNEPRVDGGLRNAGVENWDLSAVKDTTLHENIKLQLRFEFYNIFNRTQFGPPTPTVDNAHFGQVTVQANQPRVAQGAFRINF